MPSLRLAVTLAALAATPLSARPEDGPIQDNSFLVEEAYNQEPGVIQHISTFTRSRTTGAWAYSMTEEWPVLGQTHQLSATFTLAGLPAPGATGVGDLALNYRLQAIGDGESPVALAPRLSLLLPTGDPSRGLGAGGAGLQVNVPLSVAFSSFVAHSNAGGTYIPSARAPGGSQGRLASFAVGQSLVWLAHRQVNFLVEALYTTTDLAAGLGGRSETLTLNPGLRAAFDFLGGLQVVPGLGVPIGFGPSRGQTAIFLYLSLEHPFGPAGPTAEDSRKRSVREVAEGEPVPPVANADLGASPARPASP